MKAVDSSGTAMSRAARARSSATLSNQLALVIVHGLLRWSSARLAALRTTCSSGEIAAVLKYANLSSIAKLARSAVSRVSRCAVSVTP